MQNTATLSPVGTPANFAMQSAPRHVALIMDGNRRWAKSRGQSAAAGHRAGMERLLELLPLMQASSVEVLTVFAFSAANWRRERAEVDHLMALAVEAVRRFADTCRTGDVRLEVIGRRDRLPTGVRQAIRQAEQLAPAGRRRLRIALDYSSREAIAAAASNGAALVRKTGGQVDQSLIGQNIGDAGDVDLLIRTGRTQRLSDFLLWESAFAELYFPDLHWPDFDQREFEAALAWYAHRNRTFGA